MLPHFPALHFIFLTLSREHLLGLGCFADSDESLVRLVFEADSRLTVCSLRLDWSRLSIENAILVLSGEARRKNKLRISKSEPPPISRTAANPNLRISARHGSGVT
jgi:hypothetical protein